MAHTPECVISKALLPFRGASWSAWECTCGASDERAEVVIINLQQVLGDRYATAPRWMQLLVAAVEPLLGKEFVGRHELELNIFKGSIANINLNQRQSFK